MKRYPLLSVIVPIYNKEKYLGRCIESILSQKYENIEVLLIDDGSLDNSGNICEQYAKKDRRVSVLYKKNEGLGKARNSGLEISKGDYFTFVDADDYIDKDMYFNLMEHLADDIQFDAAYCDFVFETEMGAVHGKQTLEPGVYSGREIALAILGSRPEDKCDFQFEISVCKAILKKDIVNKYNITFKSEKEVISEDLYFDIEFLQHVNKVVYISNELYHYCMNGTSLTHSYNSDRINKEIEMYDIICPIIEKVYGNEAVLRFNRLFLGRVRMCIVQENRCQGHSFREKRNAIKKIVNIQKVQQIIKTYPIKSNPTPIKLFNFFVKKRMCLCIILLVLCDEFRKYVKERKNSYETKK